MERQQFLIYLTPAGNNSIIPVGFLLIIMVLQKVITGSYFASTIKYKIGYNY